MSAHPLSSLFLSRLTFILLCIGAVPLIFLRLFGFLFFASTISNWAALPAAAIVLLIGIAALPVPQRAVWASLCLMAYLLSVYFHGWPNLTRRLAEGGDAFFEGSEALLILTLWLRCVLISKRDQARRSV